MDCMLGHKTSPNKFRRIEIIPTILSDHNSMKTRDQLQNKNGKNRNTWRLNSLILKNQQVSEEIKEIRKYLKTNENKQLSKIYGPQQ